jgi:hypothetical protein
MGMKRFIIKILFFLSLMFILDRGFGVAMKYLQDHAKGGYIGHHNYILHQSKEDILIFGSSRAIHHYNPQIIEDSLGLSCYNCGQDGNGIVLFYGWWQLIKDRHCPKMIIYDVNPSFDLLVEDGNTKYLGWLRSEYDNDDVKQIFEDIDPTEKYKMQSLMYRYNSKFLQNVIDYVHPIFQISPNGYLPLKGDLDKMKLKKYKVEDELNYDGQKLDYLESFINDAKKRKVKLSFVASPLWYGKNDKHFEPLIEICHKHGVHFYNFSNDTNYVRHDEMFKDGTHLNACGADKFTKQMCNKYLHLNE